MNLVWANDSIGDFTFAPDLRGGILVWTVSGPYSALPIQMSGAENGLRANGTVDKARIQDTDASPTSASTGLS